MPAGEGFLTAAGGGEPPVPRAFLWGDRRLCVGAIVRSWRSTKSDRGDAYLKRHWFELTIESGERIEVYYDREARRSYAALVALHDRRRYGLGCTLTVRSPTWSFFPSLMPKKWEVGRPPAG